MARALRQLEDVAELVSDGQPVDWMAAESTVDPDDAPAVRELRVLAEVLEFHRRPASAASGSGRASDSVAASPDEVTLPGPVLGTWAKFTLLEEIGRGAFGVVYRAWDPALERQVALKLIPVDRGHARESARVLREGRLLARIRHPNVVTVYDAHRIGDKVGVSMELVHGRTLSDLVRAHGPFAPEEAALIGAELSRALAAVHAAGLVHRDVKARNVMRESGGRIVLMDFGAGREADPVADSHAQTAGTPVYMAPELLTGGSASAASDLYSLGVLLFFLVTGTYPAKGRTIDELRTVHREGRRTLVRDARPSVSPDFATCLDRLLEPDPARRIQTAGAAETALRRLFTTETPRRNQRLVPLVAAALLATVIGVVAIADRFGAGGSPAVRSLVVLPIVNDSGDATQEYFVDGMTDQLITELSRISSLRVTSRTSAMTFKGAGRQLAVIGAELGVETVLEASVTISAGQVRLNASLFRVSDDTRLWSDSYERPVRDALELQATLARDVATAIRLVLTPEERRALEQPYDPDQAAQDAYLRGRYVLNLLDRDRIRDSCTLFEQAVALDPKYALAWASLSRCVVFMENFGLIAAEEAAPLVTRAAETAIAEDVSLAEAHIALADARFKFDWDWHGASESYEQAVVLNPSLSFGHQQYAQFLAAAGRVEDAVMHARRAVDADPLSAGVRRTLATMLFYQRRYEEALARTDEAAALDPAFPGSLVIRARILAALGRHDEALETLDRASAATGDPAILAEIGRVHAVAGRPDRALDVLNDLLTSADAGRLVHPQDVGYVLAALGRADEAFSYLERAVDARSTRILWVRVDPRLDSLRNHTRFAGLLSRIGGLD